MSDIGKDIACLSMPEGPPHEPEIGGDLDLFNEATGETIDHIRTEINSVANVRTPSSTPLFSGLQREYGIVPNVELTTAEEIERLEAEVYKKRSNGSDDGLQAKLDRAGFNLFVYNNSPDGPAVDPAIFLSQNFQMQAGNQTVDFAGNENAYAGVSGGELLVNGPIIESMPAYFGAGDLYAGNDIAHAGYFEYQFQEEVFFPVSTNPDDWPFVFFVGGVATFAGDGSILTIQQGLVPSQKFNELIEIIMKHKPFTTSCALLVTKI